MAGRRCLVTEAHGYQLDTIGTFASTRSQPQRQEKDQSGVLLEHAIPQTADVGGTSTLQCFDPNFAFQSYEMRETAVTVSFRNRTRFPIWNVPKMYDGCKLMDC